MCVRAGERARARVPRAIRVEPRVQLESALVRLLDRERERIVVRLAARGPATPVRYCGPRLVRRVVQRVGRGTNLQDDGVEIERDASG